MTNTENLTVAKVEDYEGDGECGHCDRTGLRWIVTLSDGSKVGSECAKKLMGWKMSPKNYSWVNRFVPVAEKSMKHGNYVLWQGKTGKGGVLMVNGHATAFGGFAAIEREFEHITAF
jgi:hypothetical protein